jgi:hypothetical protein
MIHPARRSEKAAKAPGSAGWERNEREVENERV